MAESDLSSLPGLVLVELFKMLPVSDRGRLASCNRRLSTFIDNPEMWRKVTLDEFDLHVEAFPRRMPKIPPEKKFVDKLRARDFSMIEKYGQHFQKVKVVMHTGLIESHSKVVLTKHCKKDVIKSVSLRLDRLLSKVMNWYAENPAMEIVLLWNSFIDHMVNASFQPGPGRSHPRASRVIDNLCPDAEFTIALPPQSHNIRDGFEQEFVFYPDICHFTRHSFYNLKSEKYRSVLKKLMLSPLPVPEEVIARELTSGAQLSPSPTAQLISRLPNLQELHVNIINLSDQLLLELSTKPPGRQKPLRSLVIRHIVCDCEIEGMINSYRRQLSIPCNKVIFPQLSSTAWDRLAQSSPSLTVECSVVSDRLPLLLDVIKPETPLVRLEVLCRTTSSDDKSVPVLQELSENHSGLTIVGVPFRACTCTDADA